MKRIIHWIICHLSSFIAAFAMFVVTSSLSSTCFFDAYQPVLPDDLNNIIHN